MVSRTNQPEAALPEAPTRLARLEERLGSDPDIEAKSKQTVRTVEIDQGFLEL